MAEPDRIPDLILIDDDELVRMSWAMVARKRGHHILCYAAFDEFVAHEAWKNVPIYVDQLLADAVRGSHHAESLVRKGFTHVFLTTGLSLSEGDLAAGIKGVVGKDYPLK